MTDLTLFIDSNAESPWAMTAFVALEEKRLPYRLEKRRLATRETFRKDFGARTNRIPALKHGDFWLAESTAIAEYLAETFPAPAHPRLFPENLQERATCREVQHWLRTDLAALREERPSRTLWFQKATAPLSANAQTAAQRLVDAASAMLAHGRPTLFPQWCIADVDLSLALQRLLHNGTALPEKLTAYATANWARPSLAKWHALPRAATPE